jgi:hypothetical protein
MRVLRLQVGGLVLGERHGTSPLIGSYGSDYALGSVHAVTWDGTLVIASASGSQLAFYAWGAANVIFVVGAQKLVPTLAAAHERACQHSLPLEMTTRAKPTQRHVAGSPRSGSRPDRSRRRP